MGKVVAAARPTHAFDKTVTTELAEQLLQIRQRNLLSLRNGRERHRRLRAMHRHVDHRRDGKTSFCRKPHFRTHPIAKPPEWRLDFGFVLSPNRS